MVSLPLYYKLCIWYGSSMEHFCERKIIAQIKANVA